MENVISEKSAYILDLLEQIESVNQMIEVHKEDSFMMNQYLDRKNEFAKELGQKLSEFNIHPEDLAA